MGSCDVDRGMHMVAETTAPWAEGNPRMECKPGTLTAGCCWWGRGAIQTTGPHNYKLLQIHVVQNSPSLSGIDLCSNPEALCQHDALKWLAGLYYWTTVVQTAAYFHQSLELFVRHGFSNEASKVAGASFNDGTGGMVNNGEWDQEAQDNAERMENFDHIIAGFKEAGMESGQSAACEKCGPGHCYIKEWAHPCTESSDEHCPDHGEWCPHGVVDACIVCAPGECFMHGWHTPCYEPQNGGCEAGDFCAP